MQLKKEREERFFYLKENQFQNIFLDKSITLCYNNYIAREERKGEINSVLHKRESKGSQKEKGKRDRNNQFIPATSKINIDIIIILCYNVFVVKGSNKTLN